MAGGIGKGLAKEMPSPNELRRKAYKSSGGSKDEDSVDDDAMSFASELRSAIEDGDDEAIVAAFKGLKRTC